MPQLYISSHIEASLGEEGAEHTPQDEMRLARFCLQLSHLERCYAETPRARVQGDLLALELYRLLVRYDVWPTEGQLKVVTMVYEDLFKGRSQNAKMCCMWRVDDGRFAQSLTLNSLRVIDLEAIAT